ncbi:MAG TPA: hypothetical protein PLD47_13860 [Aggregatilineales bacterium]|nr:MAG: hypothetical protein HKUEN02_01170 [Anaerolineaceae bacterium]HRE48807.1 hypothetical protein [Aggregatilineales bacterium]
MGKLNSGVINQKAQAMGMDANDFITKLIEEYGSIRQAALVLNVADNTVKDFMKRRGLRVVYRRVATVQRGEGMIPGEDK